MKVDGQRTYRCADCLDSGKVPIVAKRSLANALQGTKEFPVTFQIVFCSCDAGDYCLREYMKRINADDYRFERYQAFGESRYHIKASRIQDYMDCEKCGKTGDLSEWGIIEPETKEQPQRGQLVCECGEIWTGNARKDWELVSEIAGVIKREPIGNSVLNNYTYGSGE